MNAKEAGKLSVEIQEDRKAPLCYLFEAAACVVSSSVQLYSALASYSQTPFLLFIFNNNLKLTTQNNFS